MTPNTVLVIENESATVTIVERSLQNDGYTMYSAVDANSGLQMAKELTPSLILLNLAVEGANGLEICKTIHSEDTLKDVPLILLTLREGKFDPIYTKLYGIVNFLKKPFTPEQLLENVREFAPFQAGAAAPPKAPAVSPAAPSEEPEDSFSYMEEEQEQEPAYSGIGEPLEPAASFIEVDESQEKMSPDETDDDVYTLDEDVSLEDAQAELESEESLAGGFSAEDFQQDMHMGSEDDSLPTEEDAFQMPEEEDLQMPEEDDFSVLEDTETSSPETGMGQMEEPPQDQPTDSFDLPEDVTPSPLQSAPVEEEIPDGPGLSLDGIGFDEPSEPIEPIEFEMPVEEEEPAQPKRKRAASPARKGNEPKTPQGKKTRETRRRPTSSINRPKSRGPLVVLLLLLFFVALAAGASYYFFLYKPGMPTQVAKAPAPKPVAQKPATASASQPPSSAAQDETPPPPGVKPQAAQGEPPPPAPTVKPATAPAPAVKPPAPATTPKPAVVTKPPAPKPPPPRPPAPTETAQEAGNVPAGSKYAVQFGVFSTEKNAQQLVDRLHRKGISAYIRPKKASAGKFYYYVLLEGGFKTIDAAKAKAHQIKISKGFDATVHAL